MNDTASSRASQPSQTFLITTLAMYQTVFWTSVGLELRRLGHEVAFLAFDDLSHEHLERRGLRSFNAFQLGRVEPAELEDARYAETLSQYGIKQINLLFSHERVTFGVRDSAELREKFLRYLKAAERTFEALTADGRPVVVVQELGGFLSVIASYYAARARGFDNYFSEPSFFRGRLFFLRNSFQALRIPGAEPIAVSDAVRKYLEATVASQAIVVPQKDRHQYRSAATKIVNLRNLRRLAEKLAEKYLHGKRHEFGYIGIHVASHLHMLLNSWRLRNHYTPLDAVGRFVYYPLHVPADMALTLRSPEYLDQLALIDYLARVVPHTHKIVIKEHPAMIGAIDAVRLRRLLDRYDNLVLLAPGTNNYEVLGWAEAVVSVNSKAGAEAALLGKPVVVLGDAFYRASPLVHAVDRLAEVPTVLFRLLSAPPRHDIEAVASYFQHVWNHSFPGELYVDKADNVEVFTQSLLSKTREVQNAC